MLRKTQIALALSVAWGLNPTAVLAQQAPDSGSDITRLNEITVSSTRTERRVDKVPNTVTVTPAVKIEQDGAGHGERPGGNSDWLGPPTPKAAKKHPGARTVITNQELTESGARIMPGVRVLDESSTGILPNIGVRDLNPLRSEVAQ